MAEPRIRLYNVNTLGYPDISAEFLIIDSDGSQIIPLQSELSISEAGISRDIISISCPPPAEEKKLSAIIILDISTSMEGQRLLQVKEASKNLSNLILETQGSEVGLIAFSDDAFIASRFTNSIPDIEATIDLLEANGGTNFDKAFLDAMSGTFLLSNDAQHDTHVFFLTDGNGEISPNQIAQQAAESNVTIHSIAFNINIPQPLIDISERSGGLFFSDLDTQEELVSAYSEILNYAQNTNRCSIVWQTAGCTTDREIAIEYLPMGIGDTIKYIADPEELAFFFYPLDNFAVFDQINTIQLPVEARNGNIVIDSITSSNPVFEILSPDIGTDGLMLNEGEQTILSIFFNRNSDALETGIITLHSTSCRFNEIYAIGGEDGVGGSQNGLELTRPTGGEIYSIISDTIIQWAGVSPDREITIEYSPDAGDTWETLSNDAKDFKYDVQYSDTPTDQARIRINSISNDFGQKIFGKPDSAFNTIDLAWDRTGYRIALADSKGELRIVSAIDGTTYMTFPVDPDIVSVDYTFDNIRIATATEEYLLLTNIISQITDTVITKTDNFRISDVKFHPNGRLMALSGLDSVVEIYDIRNWSLQNTIRFPDGEINSIEWSPMGDKIAATTNNRVVYVIDTINYQNYQTITATGETRRLITSVSWSPDSQKLLISTNQRRSRIIDVDSGEIDQEFQHHTVSLLNDAAWNPTDPLMAVTVAEDSRAIVYNPEINDDESSILYDFPTSYYINQVEWSPSGNRFALALASQQDGASLEVYSVDSFILQSDESDNFKLIDPLLTQKDINFVRTPLGITADTSVIDLLVNTTPFQVRIDSINITGPNSQSFFIGSNQYPIFLESDQPLNAFFQFSPLSATLEAATINTYTNIGVIQSMITGEGIQPGLSIISNELDFGELLVGTTTDTIIAAAYNSSSLGIDISEPTILQLPNTPYTVQPHGLNVLQPNDTLFLQVRFAPTQVGIAQNIAFAANNSPINPYRLKITGSGVQPSVRYRYLADTTLTECQDSLDKILRVYNDGVGDLNISQIIFTGTGSISIEDQNYTIPSRDSIDIPYIAILDDNIFNGQIEILTNLSSDPDLLPVDIFSNRSTFSISDINLILPAQETNSIESSSITLTNTGDSPIDFSYALPLNLPSTQFYLIDVSPASINPGESSIFTFEFRSTDLEGEFQADFDLQGGCSEPITLNLSANVGNNIAITDASLSIIPDTLYCEDNLEFNLFIKNAGNSALIIDSIIIGGDLYQSQYPISIDENIEESYPIIIPVDNPGLLQTDIVIFSDSDNGNDTLSISTVAYREDFTAILTSQNTPVVGDVIILSIENNSAFNLTLTLSYPNGLNNSDSDDIIIQPNSPYQTELELMETLTGEIYIEMQGICGIDSVFLHILNQSGGELSISADNISANTGDIVDLPLNIAITEPHTDSFTLSIATSLSVMRPANPSDDDTTLENTYTHFYTLSSGIYSDTIINIPYQIAWGTDYFSDIEVSVEQGIDDWIYLTESARLTITDPLTRNDIELYYQPDYLAGITVSSSSGNIRISNLPINDQKHDISIFDINGRSLLNKTITPRAKTLNLQSDLISGVYFVSISSPSGQVVKELLVPAEKR
jgi:WD40 repeat protein